MNALVTGGGGFLGGAIVQRLRARGDRVRSLSRRRYSALEALGVEQIQGDVANLEDVQQAAQGCEIVFHVAARAGLAGRYADFHRANVTGTENVLAACRKVGIGRLVHTSSPSVVFNGRDMEGVDESVPYPAHYEAHYPKSKALAEQTVRAANGPELATVALRPHLIWGPGDTNLVPRILARGKAGRLRRIGTATKLIDSVYIDNAARAHVLAADRLSPGSVVAGKVYFISNGEPMPLWDLVNAILKAGGVAPVTRSVPASLAWGAGFVLEAIYARCWPELEPPMTRFLAGELATAHWFDLSAARRDLGYEPEVSIAEGLGRLEEWLRRSGKG
jgi:nucleoside-diphosphate-sugar epimerase